MRTISPLSKSGSPAAAGSVTNPSGGMTRPRVTRAAFRRSYGLWRHDGATDPCVVTGPVAFGAGGGDGAADPPGRRRLHVEHARRHQAAIVRLPPAITAASAPRRSRPTPLPVPPTPPAPHRRCASNAVISPAHVVGWRPQAVARPAPQAGCQLLFAPRAAPRTTRRPRRASRRPPRCSGPTARRAPTSTITSRSVWQLMRASSTPHGLVPTLIACAAAGCLPLPPSSRRSPAAPGPDAAAT